ncbi:MAG: hypothetical protein LBI42_10205 [Chitinispirillales bacterium]|jgi:type I restriction enzyme R subunit|nr:hypothetical protein [Chitinispirillales bacterium]
MKFTEAQLEKAFAGLLAQENYPHFLGETLVRAADEVLIEDDLIYEHICLTGTQAEELTESEIKQIILRLKSLPASDLYESNKQFMKMLSDGFILKREDRNKKDIHIQLINYAGLEKQKHSKDDSYHYSHY